MTEQGTLSTKIMVSLWFSNEANLPKIIGLPDVMREELKKGLCKQKGQVVSSELSPKMKPLAKAHTLFHKGLEEVKGDKSKIYVVYGTIQIRRRRSCRRRMGRPSLVSQGLSQLEQ